METSCISHPLFLDALPLDLLVSRGFVAITQCLHREPQRSQSRQTPSHHYKWNEALDFLVHSPKSVLHELKAQKDSKEQRSTWWFACLFLREVEMIKIVQQEWYSDRPAAEWRGESHLRPLYSMSWDGPLFQTDIDQHERHSLYHSNDSIDTAWTKKR